MMTLLESRIGIDYDQWRALDPSTRRVVIYACLRKRSYTFEDAIHVEHRMRERGESVRKYRCCFCSAGFHVGHVPDMKAVALLARAIRDLHGDLPAARKPVLVP